MMYNNCIIPCDSTGCHFYRIASPYWAVRSMMRNVNFVETNKYVFTPEWYQGFTMVEIQRHVHDFHTKVVMEFLKPISRDIGFHLVYNIDDVIISEDIPKWNLAYEAYNKPSFRNNLDQMMNACDFIVVTTEELKNYYHEKLNVPLSNFIVIPNYLPRWWVGEAYNINQIMQNFQKYYKRPKIGITSSITHFDIMNKNNGVDDFSVIIDFIKNTTKKYEWCFLGGIPPKLKEEAEQGKITVYNSSDILNFIRETHDKEFQVIVAPLDDCVFNRGKSNIKLLEGWALGIPVIAQNISTYNQYTHRVFSNVNELQNQLDQVLTSKEWFKKEVIQNRQLIDFGSKDIPGLTNGAWLEKNIGKWIRLFTMPQRTITLDMDKIEKLKNNKQTPVGVL